ncbi:hypothetical protein YM304_06570 [Ilumatobacter coccineus YM16-304]|uniref:Uncharacterized protein n=1 Tax=Ilumatobacter coccineus (strain NBRC 103263 / KCTC 29153 / YM16-304) TaxID=1313172 RepID=A0A6C7E2C7_ILUCY|nr:hypothetical protein YM304_06570 [Ilumatobacter coccineus YM16-304]
MITGDEPHHWQRASSLAPPAGKPNSRPIPRIVAEQVRPAHVRPVGSIPVGRPPASSDQIGSWLGMSEPVASGRGRATSPNHDATWSEHASPPTRRPIVETLTPGSDRRTQAALRLGGPVFMT